MICEECRDHIDSARVYREKILSTQSHLQKLMDDMELSVKKEQINPVPDPLHTSEDEAEEGDTIDICPLEDSDPVDESMEDSLKIEIDYQMMPEEAETALKEDEEGGEDDHIPTILPRKGKLRKLNRRVCCPVCGDEFRLKGDLSVHMKVHKKKGRSCKQEVSAVTHEGLSHQKIICEVCGKGFTTKPSLALHLKTHQERTAELCEICDKYFLSLKLHVREHHSGIRTKQTCHVCGKQYFKLRSHLKWHGSKRFPCKMCEKAFFTQNDLQRHMHIHTKQKVKCRFCSHLATHEENSRLHMRKKHPAEYEAFKAENQKRLTEKRMSAVTNQEG